MIPDDSVRRAERLIAAARARGLKLATVESCTGGLIAACITAVAGSSDVFERGFVTYANDAKRDLVGVPPALIVRAGAVSEDVARAMAEGALAHAPVDAAVAVTGVAGPGGGSAEKPVGLVHIAAARKGAPTVHQRHVFPGDRTAVRIASVDAALDCLTDLVSV
jgi:nicotinamide-nucleotide amidase